MAGDADFYPPKGTKTNDLYLSLIVPSFPVLINKCCSHFRSHLFAFTFSLSNMCIFLILPQPRIDTRQAMMPKEVIEIPDTLGLPFGDDNVDTLVVNDDAMDSACAEHAKQDALMEKFNAEIHIDDTPAAHEVSQVHVNTMFLSSNWHIPNHPISSVSCYAILPTVLWFPPKAKYSYIFCFLARPSLFHVISRRQQLASKTKPDDDMGDEDEANKKGKGKGKGRGRGRGRGKGKGRGHHKKTPPEPQPADVKPPPSRKRKAKSPPTTVETEKPDTNDVSEASEPKMPEKGNKSKAKTAKAKDAKDSCEPSSGSSPAIPKKLKGEKISKTKAKKTDNSEPKVDKTSKAKKTENSEPKVDKTSKAKKTETENSEPEKSLPATWARRRRPQSGPGMLKWDTLRDVFISDVRPYLTSCISYHEDWFSQNASQYFFASFFSFTRTADFGFCF